MHCAFKRTSINSTIAPSVAIHPHSNGVYGNAGTNAKGSHRDVNMGGSGGGSDEEHNSAMFEHNSAMFVAKKDAHSNFSVDYTDIWGAQQLRTGCLSILMFLAPLAEVTP